MSETGAWLPARKVLAAAELTIEAIGQSRIRRHQKAEESWTHSWWRGRYEDSDSHFINQIMHYGQEDVCKKLAAIAGVSGDRCIFISSDDFMAIRENFQEVV